MRTAFIGGGNMATALISGMLQTRPQPEWIHVSEPRKEARIRIETRFPVHCFSSAKPAIEQANAIILATEPQVMPAVLAELAGIVQEDQLVISIAAGVTIDTITRALGEQQPVVRTMPNSPALIGKGVSGLFAGPGCTQQHCEIAEHVVSATGASVWVEEEALLNVVTAVSGSGPAYYFLLTEVLRDAGISLGLSEEAAASLALHTAWGAGAMAMHLDEDVASLRKRVTSPGGTTQAAMEAFEQGDFRRLVFNAIDAAAKRSEELAAAGAGK